MATVMVGFGLMWGACLTDPDDLDLGEETSAVNLPECPLVPVPKGIVTETETECHDGLDNDGDGLIDRCDPDCKDDSGCPSCGTDPRP